MEDEETNTSNSGPVVTDFSAALDEVLSRRGAGAAVTLAAVVKISKGYVFQSATNRVLFND